MDSVKGLLGLEIIIYSASVCPVVGHLVAVCMWLFMSRLEKVGNLCRIVFLQGRFNKKQKSLDVLRELLVLK